MADFENTIMESLETLGEKKQWVRDMNQKFKDASDSTGLDPSVLRRVKDYKYYHGNGWEGSPLVLAKEEKFKDRVSPCFRRLLTIIDDLAQTENLELLDEYIKAMSDLGIHITFDHYIPETKTSNKSISDEAIETGVSIQSSVCKLADKIRDEDSVEAENQGFGPKKEYTKLINLAYRKIKSNKDIDDKCQDALTEHNLAMQSYEYVQHN